MAQEPSGLVRSGVRGQPHVDRVDDLALATGQGVEVVVTQPLDEGAVGVGEPHAQVDLGVVVGEVVLVRVAHSFRRVDHPLAAGEVDDDGRGLRRAAEVVLLAGGRIDEPEVAPVGRAAERLDVDGQAGVDDLSVAVRRSAAARWSCCRARCRPRRSRRA